MKMQTGETYQGSDWAKLTALSEAKVGKSCSIIAGALGVLPWQTKGGIVDSPKNLHVFAFDAEALAGIRRFVTETCGAPREALTYTVWNMEEDVQKAFANEQKYDLTFYSTVRDCIGRALQMSKGVPFFHFSSATGMARVIERAIVGSPQGRGYADRDRWTVLEQQLTELQNYGQHGPHHCIWEAHIDVNDDGAGNVKEKMRVRGSAGKSWGVNSNMIRMKRRFNMPHPGTKCDVTFYDTRPNLEFSSGGRNFTEALDKEEPCLTVAFEKLNKKVGYWGNGGHKGKSQVQVPASGAQPRKMMVRR